MRRFYIVVVATTTAALSLMGCGSDSNGGSSNNGGSGASAGASSGGSSGGSSMAQCVGNNAEFTEAEFLAQTEEGKACSSASDVESVCKNDMPLVGGTCGKGCLGMGDDAQQAACVAACIQDKLTESKSAPLSDDCMACYTADVECARKNCLATCGLGPTSTACLTCRTDNGCVADFYSCSGLPEPGGSEPGGAGSGP